MSQGRLSGKTAIVTGGLSGIGRAISTLFAEEGARVVVADQASVSRDDQLSAEEVVAQMKGALFVRADVTDPTDVASLFDQAETVDVVVNNAGVTAFKPIGELSVDDYDHVMDVNVKGVFLMTREAISRWQQSGRVGTVVNIASNFALVGARNASVYCASKGAVVTFTKAVAAEVGSSGIRVNALCPGAVATALNSAFRKEEGVLEDWERRTPLRGSRGDFLGEPEQIAPAAVFLASEDSAYMTGSALVIDGGWNSE